MSPSRRTTRRQFLSGESAVEALGDLTHGELTHRDGGRLPPPGPSKKTGETYLVQFARTAMACEFQIFLTADHSPRAPEAALSALDLIDQLEDQLTVYRDHSEICQLNRQAASYPVEVESQLFALLKRCLLLYEETEGAFDITAGPLTRLWGFYKREGRLPGDEQLQQTLADIGSRHIQLDDTDTTVRFLQPGIELNLGGIGKGYALDRAAARLQSSGVDHFLLHGGRSSVLARGAKIPADPQANPWTVGIGHPRRPDRRLGLLQLRDQAMSTSGTATQSFHHHGKRYGHILDPRTGWPAEGVLSVSVLSPDAATADALSTAFYVLGPEKTEAYCERHPEVAALVMLATGSAQEVEVVAINMPNDAWETL
mgnify:CR=1 FL=1